MGKKYIEMKIDGNIFSNKSFGTWDDRTVTVKGGIEGQTVGVKLKKKKSNPKGSIEEVIERSPLETEEGCPHKNKCGGCRYQSLSYENELLLKEGMYRNLFEREGLSYLMFEEVKPAPNIEAYRNKMEYTFGDEYRDGPLALGMNKKKSFYEVVDVRQCNIVHRDFTKILEEVLTYFNRLGKEKFNRIRHVGFLRHLVIRRSEKYGEILINLVTTTNDSFDYDRFVDMIRSIDLVGEVVGILHTENDSMGDVVQADRINSLYGRNYIRENLLGLEFKISPFSFFQTNSLGAEKLYTIAREYIGEDNDIVFDLYSGTGTIAQIIAPVCKKVVGIEIVEEAVDMARENAKLNKLDNVEFLAGDVLEAVDDLNYRPNLIVVDPPREGINPKAIGKIIDFDPEVFVYISCNPVTLVRDLEVFKDRGYKVVKMTGMDMFPRTPHCETLVRLEK